MTNKASFTRIHSLVGIKVEHMDGTITTFGSEPAYEIFKAGLMHTAYNLFDATSNRWIVGTLDQLDDAASAEPEPASAFAIAKAGKAKRNAGRAQAIRSASREG